MFGWRCNERKSKILTGRRIDKALASGVPIYAKAASNVGAKPMHFPNVPGCRLLVGCNQLTPLRPVTSLIRRPQGSATSRSRVLRHQLPLRRPFLPATRDGARPDLRERVA